TDPTDAGRPGGNAAAGAGEPPATQPGSQVGSQAAAQPGTTQVPLTVLAQYVKDLSFENPRAPGIFANLGQPQSSATVAVQVQHLGERAYEVLLRMRVEGSANGE